MDSLKNWPENFEHFLVLRDEKSDTQIVDHSLLKVPTEIGGQKK